MPRRVQDAVRLRAPFGGMNLALAPRLIPLLDARAAVNVHTARGAIEVREPMVNWSAPAALNPYYTAVHVFAFQLYNAPGTRSYIACHTITKPAEDSGSADAGPISRIAEPELLQAAVQYTPNGLGGGTNGGFGGGGGGGGGDMRRELRIFDEASVYKGLGEDVLEYEGGNGQLGYAVMNDRLYIMSPATPNIAKVLVTNAAGNFGAREMSYQKPPDSAALLQPGGSLTVGVTHNYRHTYYNPTLGIESPCSDNAAATPTAGNQSIRVPYVPRGSTPPVADEATQIRIYRLKAGTDDHWYLIKTVNRASVGGEWWWTDTGADQPSKLASDQVRLGMVTPPKAQLLCAHKGRMWYAPYDAPGELWHSEYGEPGLVNPANTYLIGDPAYGDRMILMSSGSHLLAIREDAVWMISGDGPDSFVSERLYTGIGACGWFAAVETPEGIHLAHRTGIYRLGAGGIELLSAAISPAWETYGYAVRNRISVALDEKYGLVIWNVPSSTGATQYVYHLNGGHWTVWNIPVWHICNFQAQDQGYRRPYGLQLLPDAPNLRLVRMDPNATPWRDWDGADLNWSWRTGRMDLSIGRPKKYYYLRTIVDRTTLPQTVHLERALNDDDALETLGSVATDQNPSDQVFPLAATGAALEVKLSGTATAPTRVLALEVEALPVGQR